jgi:hypothetical protein
MGRVMTDSTQALAHRLADIDHELDCHLWQSETPFYNALFARSEEISSSIPHDIFYSKEFFAAYDARRAERDAHAERGAPFAVIAGGAS